MNAAVEDKHAFTDVCCLHLQVRVTTPEALQQLCVHVLPADLNWHVELQQTLLLVSWLKVHLLSRLECLVARAVSSFF